MVNQVLARRADKEGYTCLYDIVLQQELEDCFINKKRLPNRLDQKIVLAKERGVIDDDWEF